MGKSFTMLLSQKPCMTEEKEERNPSIGDLRKIYIYMSLSFSPMYPEGLSKLSHCLSTLLPRST